jgi:diguanylate cyclase (GGDEF)-like protein
MCVIDALTGLYNRVGFERYTELSFRRCKRKKKTFMLLFVDMDGLKLINDQYGHDDGDMAILIVSNALKNAGKGTEVCSRYGGDEFVIYGEDYGEEDAKAYCDKFQELLHMSNEEKLQPYLVSASCGYVIATPQEGDILDKYIDIADTYMYRQKQKKKEQKL